MGNHPLFDAALKIHKAFANEPQRQWLLDQMREWRRPGSVSLLDSAGNSLTPTDPRRAPHWPCRDLGEVNAAGELPSGEFIRDDERTVFTLPEISFALAAIHDAYRGVIGEASNVEVEPFVQRGGTLWKSLYPHYGLRVAQEQRATSEDWTAEQLVRLNDLIDEAIAAANAVGLPTCHGHDFSLIESAAIRFAADKYPSGQIVSGEHSAVSPILDSQLTDALKTSQRRDPDHGPAATEGDSRTSETAAPTCTGGDSLESACDDSPKIVSSLDQIPAKFRERGRIDGAPLTVKLIELPEKYDLKGSYLSKYYRGPRLQYGKEIVYLHGEIARLSDKKRRREDIRADGYAGNSAETFPRTIEGLEK